MQLFDSKSHLPNRIRLAIGAAVVAGLLATACAAGGDEDSAPAPAPPPAPAPAPAVQRSAADAPDPAPEPPPPPPAMAESESLALSPPATLAPAQPAAAQAESAASQAVVVAPQYDLAEAQAAADSVRSAPAAAQAAAPAAPERSRASEESAWGSVEPTQPGECWGCSSNIFRDYGVNPFVDTLRDPLSTFALDVDTASYVVTRNYLDGGSLPPMEAVRVEEFVNYFDGGYEPEWDEFAIHMEAAPSPFARDDYVLLRVGVRAPDVLADVVIPDSVIVVMDRSGSMGEQAGYGGEWLDRIELAHEAVDLLLDGLPDGTRVGIVSYDDTVSTVVEPTDVAGNRDRIIRRVRDEVYPRGSTNAGAGLERGFDLAQAEARRGRDVLVMLLSDGVANVGATRTDEILRDIGDRSEIGLTTIGVGLGPFNDVLMEQLANSADGTYHYIDSTHEARRIFGSNIVSLLALAARDAKIQVEFNPEAVLSYRLLGFENRDVADEDFRDNTVDAGEVGLGQSSTALYELELAGRSRDRGSRDWLATATLRYQRPRRGSITEIEATIGGADIARSFASASPHFRLAAVAAEFAEVLRRSPFVEYRDADMAVLVDEAWYASDDLRRDRDAEQLAQLIEDARRLTR
ncbi:MAG: von Willebrand factor type A domain-containing protein [bacterium]|nr:von Willebrand factor type A domain-containing protein [bacterium]